MKTIYALIASIDNYPIPAHRLNGCVNDAQSFSAYLKRFADANGLPIQTVELFDEKATRQGVINGFAHFDAAKNGDMCVFYYSGHGSQMPAPKEFWDESDGQSETMVCYDSRLPKGRDLADKELGYLLWKATGDKDVHFLVVTDCCHSGTITRDLNVKSRMADAAVTQSKAREYLGFSEYVKTGNSIQPPAARHIHLSAAKDNETAKEYNIGGTQRGVFTYSLVEVLEATGGRVTYANLVESLNAKVKNRVKEQSPQLNGYGFKDKTNLSFLGDGAAKTQNDFLLTFDKNNGWIVKAGALQGISTAGATFATADGTLLTTQKVSSNYSTVTGTDELPRDVQQRVTIAQMDYQRTRIALAPDSEKAAANLLRRGWEDSISIDENGNKLQRAPLLEWSDNPAKADFLMRAYNGSYRLTTLTNEIPLFRRVKAENLVSVYTFLDDVETVAAWNRKKQFNNPNSKIPKEYITVSIKNADKEEIAAPYIFQQPTADKDVPVSVSIMNTSPRTLWVSFLMFGCDFSITNEFLPKRELSPGETAVVEVYNEPSIPLIIPQELFSWGVNEVQECFRIFVSADELDTTVHNQAALAMDMRQSKERVVRGKPSGVAVTNDDWCVIDIPYTLIAPFPERDLKQSRAVSLTDWMTVESPNGFSAKVTLSADSPAQRTLSKRPARSVRGTSKVALAEGLSNTPPLDVLELSGVTGQLSEANPLKINVKNIGKEDHVIAVQYDEKSGLYFPVGRSVDGVIHITQTPKHEASTVATRSLFGAAKILFQKLIVSKLTGEYEYPLLRMATFASNQDENFTYVTEHKAIDAAIQGAENIALVIHGLIGDSQEMTKAMVRSKKREKPLLDNYQVVLTLDYDTMSTSIEETAGNLKDKLEALGLVAGHGKQLDIIAHSLGGLVSRHFIEKLGGNQVATRLIQFGTPNTGTEITQLKDIVKTYSMLAINGLPAFAPWMTPLTLFANYLVKNLQVTIDQLKPDSPFLKKLNDSSDPGIPYFIIAGNTRLIKKTYPKETTFIQKVIANLKEQGVYYVLEQTIFKSDNDLVVRTDSAKGIAGKEGRAQPVTEVEIANDHLSYFSKPEGLKALAEVVYGKK
ncbi:MAG: hypothetical protein RIS64_400 [Bacteroidota bacterium]|jgi:hypothetical protein